jgi:hypothetical protein
MVLVQTVICKEEGLQLKLADSQWQIIDDATLHRYADGDLRSFSQASTRVCTVVKGTGGELQ